MNEETNNNLEQELDLNQLMIIRREKLEKLKQNNKNPFEITKFDITHTSKEIIDNYEELEGKDVTIAGRIMAKRIMGKASFCHIQDGDGKIQSYVSINDLGEESYKQFKEDDIGDIIGITGFVFKTRTGEISIHAKEVTLLTKSFNLLSTLYQRSLYHYLPFACKKQPCKWVQGCKIKDLFIAYQI